MEKESHPFRETIERTAKNGRIFSLTLDRLDAERNPRIREVAIEKLDRAVLYEDLPRLDEWRLKKW